jgi:hypothetical protein
MTVDDIADDVGILDEVIAYFFFVCIYVLFEMSILCYLDDFPLTD